MKHVSGLAPSRAFTFVLGLFSGLSSTGCGLVVGSDVSLFSLVEQAPLRLDRSSLAFGSVQPLNSKILDVSVTVAADKTLENLHFSFSNAGSSVFWVTGNSCLSPGIATNCMFSVQFYPSGEGSWNETLTIYYTIQGKEYSLSVPVRAASSTAAMPADLLITPVSGSDFGMHAIGAAPTYRWFELKNIGSSFVSAVYVTLNPSSPGTGFSIAGHDCPAVMDAGSSCFIQIGFSPVAAADPSVDLVVYYSQGENSSKVLDLIGSGPQ